MSVVGGLIILAKAYAVVVLAPLVIGLGYCIVSDRLAERRWNRWWNQ